MAVKISRGGCDVLMVHQNLNCPQILRVRQQRSGKGVAKGVWSNPILADPRLPTIALDHLADRTRGHPGVVGRDEQCSRSRSLAANAEVLPR